ncbi:MAG: hypothetical protein IT294_15525 [Deltaproteobacteria bacterium]|nr:hypothetical protein [Deltaproteobacteria bacterium]
MRRRARPFVLAPLAALLAAAPLRADEQVIAPGTGLQSSIVADTGADGICTTTAATGDIQAAPVGGATPHRNEIRCGANKVVESAAAGDDVQLIALGATCQNANRVAVDTGPNGVPETALGGDDTYPSGIALGVAPANTPCVIAGADGVAQTLAPAGDDVQLLPAGTAAPNTDVVRCGPNLVADTTANNFGAGDDVQLVPVGNACTASQAVVDAGADGIAATRAEGPDFLVRVAKSAKVNVKSGDATGGKTIKLEVSNVEFGPAAPLSRTYTLTTSDNSCGGGAVTQLDADAATPGLQATASVPIGGKIKATVVVSVKLQDVISVSTRIPFRCTFDVHAVALDTAPDVDDAQNPENNTTTVDLEVFDRNDL